MNKKRHQYEYPERSSPMLLPMPSRGHRYWARWLWLAVLLLAVGLLPLPWLVSAAPNPPGMAWRLDGRLQFNGHTIDPPGSWVGLTAGRPPVVAEVIFGWFDDDAERPRDLREGSIFSTPAMAEPAAIAIGLIEAGRTIEVTTMVEARNPLVDGLPQRISVSEVNGQVISSREDWSRAVGELSEQNEIITTGGNLLPFAGSTFPYRTIHLRQFPIDLEVSLAGWASLLPDDLYRKLALGRSHGLLLALAAYADATDTHLTKNKVIAATGVIRADGSVGRIGGLSAKARAADRAGVEILFYPAGQHCEAAAVMESLDSTAMTMIPVATLAEAIHALGQGPPSPDAGPSCSA